MILIPSSRVPPLDQAPGLFVREWYLFLLNLLNRTPARGGIRKTTAQTIGSMSTTWIDIVDYAANMYAKSYSVSSVLADGVIKFLVKGDYTLIMNIAVDCSTSGGSHRKMEIRLFNVTDNLPIPYSDCTLYISSNAGGASESFSLPVSISQAYVNKNIRMQLRGLTSFSGVSVVGAMLAAVSVDSNA
jgi:hypothetical protein